jgi:CRISPR/Cas system-associated exonuclease Cas4 (RecB family)
MKFTHEPIDLGYNDLSAKTTKKGRQYVDPDGNTYPSITTVLSILSEDSIRAWRARVGEEKANQISRIASTRGTTVHNIIEKYVANDPEYIKDEMPHNVQTFKDVQKVIDEGVTKVYQQEAPLYSKHLGVAGRVDCVGQWNGKDSIIDWKTSRKHKKKEWISSYFMQCAAYAIMWEERTGMPIKQLVVCIAGDEGSQVFVEDRDNWTEKLIETINEYKRRKLFGR